MTTSQKCVVDFTIEYGGRVIFFRGKPMSNESIVARLEDHLAMIKRDCSIEQSKSKKKPSGKLVRNNRPGTGLEVYDYTPLKNRK